MIRFVTLVVALPLLLLQCTTSVADVEDPDVFTVFPVSGDNQSDTVGHELPEPLVVSVRGMFGAPRSGLVINFSAVSGGGSVSSGTAITDGDGLARVLWTLGTDASAEQFVHAYGPVTVWGTRDTLTFNATAVPDAPADLSIVGDTSLVLPALGDTARLAVTVSDQYGNPVVDPPAVVWSSANVLVAAVDSEGLVTATGPGETMIFATAGSLTATAEVEALRFYRDDNGVTVRCERADVGDTREVGGVTYTKRTREDLLNLVAAQDSAAIRQSCTSGITDMAELFRYQEWFNGDIGSWDVSSVTDMREMFAGALAFDQAIGDWDVSHVTDMGYMFQGAGSFHQPIGSWDVRSVTDMSGMFWNARVFNADIGSWDVSSVTLMSYMFAQAYAFDQPISDWNVSNVTHMNAMFLSATAFNRPVGDWDVSSVRTTGWMFRGATAFNQPLASWDLTSATDLDYMFAETSAFNQDVGSWNVASATGMRGMFQDATAFNRDLSGWCVSGITSPPADFDTNATSWTLPRPVWGTCPGG